MNENELLFNRYFDSINEILEQTVKFHLFSKYCQKVDFSNNKDYENHSTFIDNFFICSNYARISCLNKLIDRAGFSFFSLIKFVKNHPQLFNKKKEDTLAEIVKVEGELNPHMKLIETLVKQRNEFHAHMDWNAAASESMYNVFFENAVSEEEINQLILTLCSCILKLNYIFNETYESNFIYKIVNTELNLYEIIEVEKVFNLMKIKSCSQHPPLQNVSDLYYNNLTKKY